MRVFPAGLALVLLLGACVRANPAYHGPAGDGDGSAWLDASREQATPPSVDLQAVPPDVLVVPELGADTAPPVEPADGGASEVPPLSALSILLVVGSLSLDPMDAQVSSHLTGLGARVTVQLDETATAAGANNQDLVIISGSTFTNQVGSKFKTVPIPVICNDSWTFPRMGLTGATASTDYGRDDTDTPPNNGIALVGAHPLGANLSGVVTVADRPIGLAWGRPAATAVSVATLIGDSGRVTLFGYQAGARLHDGTIAPARRVASFVRNPDGARLTGDGLRLVQAAVAWATGR